MSWHLAAAGRRLAGVLIALIVVLCSLGSGSLAQNACRPKDEIFGGYAFLAPNGWGDLDYKINIIPNAFDASNTYYLPKASRISASSLTAAATSMEAPHRRIYRTDRMTAQESATH